MEKASNTTRYEHHDADAINWRVIAEPVRAAATALQEHVADFPDISLNDDEEYILASIAQWKRTYTELDADTRDLMTPWTVGLSGTTSWQGDGPWDDGIIYTWSEGWGA